jgi:hypothetical protein
MITATVWGNDVHLLGFFLKRFGLELGGFGKTLGYWSFFAQRRSYKLKRRRNFQQLSSYFLGHSRSKLESPSFDRECLRYFARQWSGN